MQESGLLKLLMESASVTIPEKEQVVKKVDRISSGHKESKQSRTLGKVLKKIT